MCVRVERDIESGTGGIGEGADSGRSSQAGGGIVHECARSLILDGSE